LWQELFTAPRYEHASLGMRAVFFLPLLFAIVAFSWFFIEKPAMRVGRRLSKQVSRDRASEMAKI
jgi:peptidoglycan/LPS O-acetylase OafA/YrhL